MQSYSCAVADMLTSVVTVSSLPVCIKRIGFVTLLLRLIFLRLTFIYIIYKIQFVPHSEHSVIPLERQVS
jgi:hypothetical protein